MDEGCEQRVQEVQRGERDAHAVDDERADEVLSNDGPATSGNPHRLDKLQQIVSEKNDVGCLASDLGSGAHPDPYQRFG
jgi:hypothetical protein